MIDMKFKRPFHPGDCVVFSAPKHSTHPGVRAKDIRPELYGDGYFYVVEKFWVVNERRGAQVALVTRRGKVHVVDADDPHLHRASWWERLIHRNRFPKLPTSTAQNRLAV
jgi:hypothetical protein